LSEAAVRDNGSDAQALALLGHIRRMAGDDPRESLALIEHAQRLSPRDPRTFLGMEAGSQYENSLCPAQKLGLHDQLRS
jgi:hypothetical protein